MPRGFLARAVRCATVMQKFLIPLGACLAVSTLTASGVGAPSTLNGESIRQDLLAFQQCASVLYVAAHPDDENTQLITYFSRGRNYRTAYISVTRGDGGQNIIGAEFGDELGVIRTQELIEARKIDGGRQFFTRAIDFGFSKSDAETLRIWDRNAVLADMVRIIREFRPDVIVTRFSPEPGKTHGHHTASAILAVDAFALAGNPGAFPERLETLKPWQATRIVQNGRFGGSDAEKPGTISFDISGTDPVSGESFDSIAAKSRAMHISQGFAGFAGRGAGPRMESFQPLGGEPAKQDLFDGIDSTWARYSGDAVLSQAIASAISAFDAAAPQRSVPALLAIRAKVSPLAADPVVNEKLHQLDRIIAACLGLTVHARVATAEMCPGEAMHLRLEASARADVPIRWVSVQFPGNRSTERIGANLSPGTPESKETVQTLPANTPLTQPYWLREPGADGISTVSDPTLIGAPENPPAFPIDFLFEIGGQQLTLSTQPQAEQAPGAAGLTKLTVIPPVTLAFHSPVRLFAPGSVRTVQIELTAARPEVSGELALNPPAGWNASPASIPFRFAAAGERKTFEFQVTAPDSTSSANLTASAQIGNQTYGTRRIDIRYDHIACQVLQPQASLRVVSIDLTIRGKRIGYLPGAGDSVAECLRQMGFDVRILDSADVTPDGLADLDAVVLGVRALNARKDLPRLLPVLSAFAEAGGTVVMQYNRPEGAQTGSVGPFELALSGDRVTDVNAPVTLLAPDHAVFKGPNTITEADFNGWVQERGLAFPSRWDARFVPLLACADPGEQPLNGGLLVADIGKGRFIYTSLAWFRQLPAGVPGAYRLFANLVAPAQ
ncbi:MAG: PIG-L family deacetylase [Planctomycetes bacterium]|nr:PIG-L family deacetylase [Planctomycetota bacterium]